MNTPRKPARALSSEPHPLSPSLVNAAQMAETHPATFFRPDADTLAAIGPGHFVKVCAGGERFWVSLEEVRPGGILVGKVDNHLLFAEGLSLGDRIQFHIDNVYDVTEPF